MVAGLLVQVPAVAVSVSVRAGVPVTVGAVEGCGRGWSSMVSGALCAVALRPGEVTVAVSTMVWLRSAAPSR
jgi:hypothetical protein